MNKKILFVFLISFVASMQCSRQKPIIIKYPEGIITQTQKSILDNPNQASLEFNNAITPEDKFEIAILSGKFEYIANLPSRNGIIERVFGKNKDTVYVEDLINIEMDPIKQSKALHMAIKVAAYQRTYQGAQDPKYSNMVKTIQVLVERKADLNALDSQLRTPLHIACELSELEGAAIILSDKTVDPLRRDAQGKTPLEYVQKDNKMRRAFEMEFNESLERIVQQNKKDINTMINKNKVKPTPMTEEPAIDPSLPSYKSARELSLENEIDMKKPTKKLKRGERRASRSNSAVITERPASASPTHRITIKQSTQKLTITEKTTTPSQIQTEEELIQTTQTKSIKIGTTRPLSHQTFETRYLTPGLSSVRKQSHIIAPPASVASQSALDVRQATNAQATNPEPVLIISPTEVTMKSPTFNTPIKSKPVSGPGVIKSEGLLSNMYNALFGPTHKVAPGHVSPRTESTTSSPAQNHEPLTPEDVMHKAPIAAKPAFTKYKSSSKIYAV